MKLRVVASTALLALLGGCEDVVARRSPPDTSDFWTIEADATLPHSCGCAYSQPMYIKNGTTGQRSITLVETANYIDQPSQNAIRKRDFTVPGNGAKFLQCSIDTTYSTCDTTYSWDKAPPGSLMSKILPVKAKALPARLPQGTQARSGLSCEAECFGSSEPGARCLLFDNQTGGDTPEHGLLAAVRALGENGRKSRADLLQAWHKQDADEPCNRGEARTSTGRFFNAGSSCEIEGSFGPGARSKLVLPPQLLGTYKSKPDGFSISFTSPNASPSVTFDNPYLNSAYGGQISRIEQTRGYFLMRSGQACVGLKL